MAVIYLPISTRHNALSPDILALSSDSLPTTDLDGTALPNGFKAFLSDTATWKVFIGTWVTFVGPAGSGAGGAVTVADGADVAEGATTDAAVAAGAAGSISAKLRRLTTSKGLSSVATITRPANQTPYTALDVLGGALTFANLAPAAGQIEITGVQLEADIAAIPAGQTTFTLYLYNVTPPSAIADNGAWDLPSGDRASFLGSIAIPALVDLGSTLYVESNNLVKLILAAGTSVFGYLVTTIGFTPAANSEVYVVTLHSKAL